MAMKIGSSGNDYAGLFNSITGNASNQGNEQPGILGSSMLSDYASIKNGSYARLAKAYYSGKGDTKADKEAEADIKSLQKKEYAETKTNADALKSSTAALADSKTLFGKITVKDEDGNDKESYDYDKIASSVKKFVEDYNSMVKNGGESNNNAVLRNTLSMVNMTAVNENLLKNVGITIKSDNTLSLDEEAIKTSNISDLKSLFSGTNSYAGRIASNASGINTAASDMLNRMGGYTANGGYKGADSVGNIYDGAY